MRKLMRPIKRSEPTNASDAKAAAVEYKSRLQNSIERMETEYDKALLTLNPAAITISIALYNQLIVASKVPRHIWLLHSAWGSWGIATLMTVASFLLSKMALDEALKKFDEGRLYASNYKSPLNQATEILNLLAGAGFLLGIAFAAFFFK
jgi:hypothetical protein